MIKDIGVSALGHGYGQLQSIDLTGYIRRLKTSVYQHWGMDMVSCSRLISLVIYGGQPSVYQHWGISYIKSTVVGW